MHAVNVLQLLSQTRTILKDNTGGMRPVQNVIEPTQAENQESGTTGQITLSGIACIDKD